jgi:TatA/E family protein of Tat protein translocase
MPNIGAPELIIILVIALLILGPGKLPEVGASIGKSLREFRKASSDVQEATKLDVSVAPIPPAAAPVAAAAATPAAPAPDADAIAAARATLAAAAAADVAGPSSGTEPAASAPTSESSAASH